ncbi:MAG: sulfite exporter TauE/SafE family protein, partial [Bifidobacteriaceae bacterium]|nr:sulfite exporter TauE/SafE family protein [Bifidobacteriaceae bacterium]
MTCAACEVRIGKLLRGLPGVTDVTVSRRRGEAIVTSNRPLDMAMAASRLDKAGYSLAREKRAWISHNPSVWWDLAAGVVLVGLIAVAWRQLGAERLGNVVGPGGIGANLALVVVLGVAASLSTCMALVGGLVVGLSARFAETHPQATTVQRLRPQVMFNLGRIVGFTVLGAMIGLVGGLVTIQGAYLGVTMIIVGVVMGLLAIKLTDISPR